MSSNFGAPIQSQGSGTPASSDTPQQVNGQQIDPSTTPQELLDPSDPRLTSEALDVNTEGDAYAQPAPPPDARYRAKLKLEGVKDAAGQKHDYLAKMTNKVPKLPYFATAISASIIDPSGKYDGITAYDSWVGTFQGKDGSTKVATILGKLTKPDGTPWVAKGTKFTHKDWMELFVQALAGEPEIGIETQWEWSCQECGKLAKAQGTGYPKSIEGMQKFPPEMDKAKRAAGQLFNPEMKCPVNAAHGYSRARIRIGRFLSLSELGK